MTTEQQVRSYLEQPKRYFNIDGLGEIGIGVMMLGFALIGWVQVTSPKNSMWNQPIGMPLMMLCVGLMSFGIDRGTKFIKKRLTYPRTGFVQYRRSAKSVILILLMSGVGAAVFMVILIKGYPTNIAVATALIVVPSYAYGIARDSRWKWAVVAVLTAGSLAVGSLPQALVNSWFPVTDANTKALRDSMHSWILEAALIGATLLISGAITLFLYVRETRDVEPAAE